LFIASRSHQFQAKLPLSTISDFAATIYHVAVDFPPLARLICFLADAISSGSVIFET